MKIATVQMDVSLGQVDLNLSAIEVRLREAVSNGAKLVVFPECAVSGYCFESLAEALLIVVSGIGPRAQVATCQKLYR